MRVIATRISLAIRSNTDHALLAGGGEGVDEGAAQQHAVRAQGEHAYHVQAGADAGIRQDRQVALHGVGDGRQGPGRGEHAIELAPAVVGDHDAVRAEAHRLAGVLRVENALEHKVRWPR